MSFFFDVWTSEGFILASDVLIMENGERKQGRKLASDNNQKRPCAITVCGDYPEASINYFAETVTKDTLRKIAEDFAVKWTKRFAGSGHYSAVHLVGFEKVGRPAICVPQVWYWSNWSLELDTFYDERKLDEDLESFTEPIPRNNHIPFKVKELAGKFPDPTLESEEALVKSFLKMYEPYFTWNGDSAFWRTAAATVSSAMELLRGEKTRWALNETGQLAHNCLTFLADIGKLLPTSTVGLSSSRGCDVVGVSEDGIERYTRPDVKARPM